MESALLTKCRKKLIQTRTSLREDSRNGRLILSPMKLEALAAVQQLVRHQPAILSLPTLMRSLRSKAADLFVGITPDVTVADWEPHQGDTVVVIVRVPPPRGLLNNFKALLAEKVHGGQLVSVTVEGAPVPAYPSPWDASRWRAMVPTTPLDSPGPFDLTVWVRDWNHRPYKFTLNLREVEWPIESIYLPPNKVGVEATAVEELAVAQLGRLRTEQQLWEGPLRVPCCGEVTTPYGVRRYYDGVFATRYFHGGVDYGADYGDEVVMPAGGRVALVGWERDGFSLHGNCVGVDHGQGLTSLFMHLRDICVKEGDMVGVGDHIGHVGSTGRATGPHLHWGLAVHGLSVNPELWMGSESSATSAL